MAVDAIYYGCIVFYANELVTKVEQMYNQIRYFISVVNNGNFTKAADECHISQPAISQQIKELEDRLGVKLLKRVGRSFEVTEAGRYFYNRGQEILANIDQLIEKTREVANQQEKEYVLKAGYLRSFGTNEFLKTVAEFSAQYPNVKLKIISGTHDQLFDGLEDDRIDIAFSDLRRAPAERYVNKFLTESSFEVLLNKSNIAQNQKSVDVQKLRNIPCILVTGPSQRKNEESYYRNVLGINTDFVLAQTYDEASMMATIGQGFLIINDRLKNQIKSNQDLAILSLTSQGKKLEQKYYAFWKADNSGYYIESFYDILKKQFNN